MFWQPWFSEIFLFFIYALYLCGSKYPLCICNFVGFHISHYPFFFLFFWLVNSSPHMLFFVSLMAKLIFFFPSSRWVNLKLNLPLGIKLKYNRHGVLILKKENEMSSIQSPLGLIPWACYGRFHNQNS